MCDNWKSNIGNNYSCEGVVLDSGDGEFVVKGSVNSIAVNPTVIFGQPIQQHILNPILVLAFHSLMPI